MPKEKKQVQKPPLKEKKQKPAKKKGSSGLNELVDLLNLMGTAPPGERPQLNPELIRVIRGTALKPVLDSLMQGIYEKLCAAADAEQAGAAPPKAEPRPPRPPTPPPPPPVATPTPAPVESAPQQQQHVPVPMDAAELKDIEAGIKSLSSKLDPALLELSQGIEKLQVGLFDIAKAEKTRLEVRVNELEKEVKDLQQVIDATRTELLPVEVASKIALQGMFSEDADKASPREGKTNATGNVVLTAKKVRTNTMGLIAKCRALFTFINRDPTTGSKVPDLGIEGEWGRCAEHLRASNTRLRSALEEKEESAQKLQFVGFVVDQIRKGRYTKTEWKNDVNGKSFVTLIEKSPDGFASIQLLAQDISRLTATAMPPTMAPGYEIPPVYGTPPATLAADAMASQTFRTPVANAAWAVSTTTGGTRPWGRGNASTHQSSAATSSLASLLSS
ncbi:hypothetical protein FRC04_003699 [Tulasnella sp. 424]|nr:hypothetical protein FRC04_003699 [Tulasnella sp. 424]KAG8977031.1 hypothetical protein FRC05_002551 [Tulasnella sp. 425]